MRAAPAALACCEDPHDYLFARLRFHQSGNHEKVLQLQFIDPDVRFISYSTLHPRHDMQHLLKEVDKAVQQGGDAHPLICGVGLGGFGRSASASCAAFARRCSTPICTRKSTCTAR